MKVAYIVQGTGESTGCRFLTQVLINCGIYGSAEHTQAFQHVMYDDVKFAQQVRKEKLNNLVVRQSQPHGSNLPSLLKWYNRLKNAGFDKIYTIITTRAQPPQISSTISSSHLKLNPINKFLKNPDNRIKSAYKAVFGDLAKIENGNYNDFVSVNLGNLSTHPYVNLRYVLESVGIDIPKDFDQSIVKSDIDTKRINEYRSSNYRQ